MTSIPDRFDVEQLILNVAKKSIETMLKSFYLKGTDKTLWEADFELHIDCFNDEGFGWTAQFVEYYEDVIDIDDLEAMLFNSALGLWAEVFQPRSFHIRRTTLDQYFTHVGTSVNTVLRFIDGGI